MIYTRSGEQGGSSLYAEEIMVIFLSGTDDEQDRAETWIDEPQAHETEIHALAEAIKAREIN